MMNKGELIGPIVRLQVQMDPIKVKGSGYLPHKILPVQTAAVDAWGMVGRHEGAWVVDAHHKAHPASRAGGRRPLSVGFTGHYRLMGERFESAPAGIAGENILVDGPALALGDLGEGLVIETSNGDLVRLERPRVAAPCVEFTSFMLGLDHVAPLAEIEEPLAALHDGRRGFIVAADHDPNPIAVSVGDLVYFGI
jgi:hypothetical protein